MENYNNDIYDFSETYSRLDNSAKMKYLVDKLFAILAGVVLGVFLVAMIFSIVEKSMGGLVFSLIFLLVPAIALAILSFRQALKKEPEKRLFIISKLVREESKNYLGDPDIFCYQYDSLFRDRLVANVRTEQDNQYKRNINIAQTKINQLSTQRNNEIVRIRNAQWTKQGQFQVNIEEGLVRINNQPYNYNEIYSAEVNTIMGNRTIIQTQSNTNSKSKKHVSVGGAVVGGIVAGPIGAVVGGTALGKTTTKSRGNEVTTSRDIPTCNYVSVVVNMSAGRIEIPVLNRSVDLNSGEYTNAINKANSIVASINNIKVLPRPSTYIPIEQRPSVLIFDSQIANAQSELQAVYAAVPTYELPAKYNNIEIKL